MIYEELLIDGVSVDMSEDTDITLEINSNIFNDITEITTNRSYTISLPKTVRNMTLLGNCDKIGISGKIPFTFHNCEYRRNGVPIIRNGRATIKECKDDISVNIYWGLFPFLEKLIEEDKNLNELSNDLHILFNAKNELSEYTQFVSDGYGYADYNPYQYEESNVDDWTTGMYAQVEEETTDYSLVNGKVYTGEEVGGSSSGGIVDDEYYQCVVVPFLAGFTAKISNVVGQGENRAYAVIDDSGTVIELADETSTTGETRGDLDNSSAASFFSTEYLCPIITAEITITKCEVMIEARETAGVLEYGFMDSATYEVELLGSVDIPAAQEGLMTIDINKIKPEGKYFFIRQTTRAAHFLLGYPDLNGMSDLGRYSTVLKQFSISANYNVCFKVYYDSSTPVPQFYSVQAPVRAAKLIVNNDKRYSSNASVQVTDNINYNPSFDGFGYRDPLQPVVTCWWVLQQIAQDYKVTFDFSDNDSYIKSLALPLVTRDADSESVQGDLTCSINTAEQLGTLELNATELPATIQLSDDKTQIKVISGCTLIFEIQAHISYSLDGSKPVSSGTSSFGDNEVNLSRYSTYPDYIKMTVTHRKESGEDPDVYLIGIQDEKDLEDVDGNNLVDWMYTKLIYGYGKIELLREDTIKFELCNKKGRHKSLICYDGLVNASLEETDEVPYGGMFPIIKNLPEISITDYIKTLTLLSGTFPLQQYNGDTVSFARYDKIWENKDSAIDWTKKLIPYDRRNKPRETQFNVDNYYQHNYYKWKEDDQTKGKYDGEIKIKNETLEYENDAWELPFAASDGNRIPLYTPRKDIKGTFTGSNGTVNDSATDSGGRYSSCEPRIMNVSSNNAGKAALNFAINLPNIFDTKYANLINTITNAVVITEYLYLSDLEIMNFDETIPVYFAQYGAYFAVLSIKVSSDGYSEVEMIKLNI